MNWKNVPLPEGHLIALTLGIILQVLLPRGLLNLEWISYTLGVLLLLAGISLAGWSVYAAREIDVESPEQVITTGPYAFSRNPMYVAWSLIYLAVILLVNSLWLLLLFPLVLIYTHYFIIALEEKLLEEKFGAQYVKYKSRVRRYF